LSLFAGFYSEFGHWCPIVPRRDSGGRAVTQVDGLVWLWSAAAESPQVAQGSLCFFFRRAGRGAALLVWLGVCGNGLARNLGPDRAKEAGLLKVAPCRVEDCGALPFRRGRRTYAGDIATGPAAGIAGLLSVAR
jgi:hypothetical protein